MSNPGCYSVVITLKNIRQKNLHNQIRKIVSIELTVPLEMASPDESKVIREKSDISMERFMSFVIGVIIHYDIIETNIPRQY